MTEKRPEEKKTSEENFSPLNKKIIDRLGWGLMIIGLGITLIILTYALSGSLYDGIGPIKLAVLLMGLLFLLAGGVVLILKPASPVEKYQGFLARLTLIKSEIPEETLAKIEPVRFLFHAVGFLGIILIYFYAISDLGFKGFGPLKLTAMALFALLALSGFMLYLPGVEKFPLWLSDTLGEIWYLAKKVLAQLWKGILNLIQKIGRWKIMNQKAGGNHSSLFRVITVVFLKILQGILKVTSFILLIVLMGCLLFLIGRELYLTTVPEPVFYKRLIRGLLLGGIIIIILTFSKIKAWGKGWALAHREKLQQIKQKNITAFLTAGILILLTLSGEIFFRIVNPSSVKVPDNIAVYEILNDLPYNYWDLRNETNNAFLIELQTDEPFYLSKDYSGQSYNSKDGVRLTTGQPKNPENFIHLVGADLLLSLTTPDEMTPASLLQEKLNQAYDENYAVLNQSGFGYFAFQSLARLKNMEIKSGDVVVFVVGTRDADVLNAPNGFVFSHLIDEGVLPLDYVSQLRINPVRPHQLTIENLLIRSNNFLLKHSALYRALMQDDNFYPDNFDSIDEIDALLAFQAQELGEIVLDANHYVTEAGGKLIVVLEPNLFTLADLTDRELALAYENQELYQVGHRFWTIPLAYAYFRETFTALEASYSIDFYDLSYVEDAEYRQEWQEVYVMWNEILPSGNQIFANALFEILGETLD